MNKSINYKFRQSIIIISIIVTVVFLVINISLYVINNNYLVNKVKEENSAFLQITTHIINENELPVALEYVEHYTHIHEVNIEVLNEQNEMIFSSNVSHRYTTQYTIETTKGAFTVFMDNTESITVNRIEMNTIYVNISLLTIYIIAIIVLFRINKRDSNRINHDITYVLELMKNKDSDIKEFNYSEFEQIYSSIILYLENIDMLTEQKEMNMKGLAHDIKTPLTLVYSYFERVNKGDKISDEDREIAFESSKRINVLLNDLIENKERFNNQKLNLSNILSDRLDEHISVFQNKNINVVKDIQSNIFVEWNMKDLTRVFDNLISNAYYYSKNRSNFQVVLREDKGITLDFISSPENLTDIVNEKMFLKGYRGTQSSNSNSYGKGFGLYLCKILLNAIGGSITVSEINENVKFTINL